VYANTLFNSSAWNVTAILVLCLLEAATIVVLVASRSRLRRSEQALRVSDARNEAMLRTMREITDRRHEEEAFNRSQVDVERLRRLTGMGELVASIAHEVNQPLCAIIANARAGLRSHPCQSPAEESLVREALEDIVKDARRASDVIHETRRLFVERTNAKALVNANELIEHVVDLARRSFDAANVSVRTALTPDLPDMLADPILLRQVLLNLAINAIDAVRESARREVTLASSLDESGGLVEICVSDTGWGLHPEEAQEVFRAFHTTKAEGMGKGLAISRAIIAAQGGRLWATQNLEGGASFRFAIPISPAAEPTLAHVAVAPFLRR
jgi:C4-dicarboxylate-specific signal transduction histidine kinase